MNHELASAENSPVPQLPVLAQANENHILAITTALGVPRHVVATVEEISQAWSQLPILLGKVDPTLRDDLLARMCIATATGLFDGAINYCWNATINELRNKIRRFGLPIVAQILQKNFDEAALM